jgi:hypothetical protein
MVAILEGDKLAMLERMLRFIGAGATVVIEYCVREDGDEEFDVSLYGDRSLRTPIDSAIANDVIARGVSALYLDCAAEAVLFDFPSEEE